MLLIIQKDERTDEKEKDIGEHKCILDDLNKQLIAEINNFKYSRENDLLMIIKKFFKDKCESNNEINQVII